MKSAQKTNKIVTPHFQWVLMASGKEKSLPFSGSPSFSQTENIMVLISTHLFKH